MTNIMNNNDLNVLEMYLKEISCISLLDENEERILFMDGSEEAYKKIIESNLRLVVNISKNYINRGLSLEDIIQEGNIGLINAVYNYDITKEVKFSTFATILIKKYIRMAIIKYNCIHQNPKIYYKLLSLKQLYGELYIKLGRRPSLEEISIHANINNEAIEKIFSYNYQVESFYSPIKKDSEEVLLDFIVDYNKSVEDIIIDKEYLEFINFILFKSNLLNEQEQYIFINRFGFNNKIMSYDEIGEKYNVSGEAIRQKIVKVIIRLLKQYGNQLVEYSSSPSQAKIIVDNALEDKFKIFSFKAKNRKK